MESSQSPFIHQPLQLDCPSIRVVKILEPDTDGTISCAIKHVTLEAPSPNHKSIDLPHEPVYTCLSYVWGASDQMRRIKINGEPFQVRCNLWDFLNTVSIMSANKHSSSNRWYNALWIDALCIDQENSLERNHQVQQMGQIYADAAQVVVWMGVDADLTALFRSIDTRYTTSRSPADWDLSNGFQATVKNVYWQRAWIVQKLLLARHVFLFTLKWSIPMYKLKSYCGILPPSHAKDMMSLLHHFGNRRFIAAPLPETIENVEFFRYKDCADVRDRIYSMLSISHDGKKLSVNYDCSPVELVRSTLSLDEDNICLQRVFVLLEALQIDYKLDDPEVCLPIIARDGETMMRHMSPCFQCYEDTSGLSPRTPGPALLKERYICLHCNHFTSSALPGIHQVCYHGHLCIKWNARARADSADSHLFWIPAGGRTWHELQSYKYVMTKASGALQRLILSVGLLSELKSLVLSEEGRLPGNTMQRGPDYTTQSLPKPLWAVTN
jgi:hypothetical protein